MLDQITQWLANLSTPIATAAEIISGFSTFIIAILTLFLWRENRALRRAGSEPRVAAYFEPHPDGTGGLNIAIANIGTGPARNVTFSIEGDAEEFNRYNLILECAKKRPPMTLIPQGEKISFLFAVGYQLFKPKDTNGEADNYDPIKPFYVHLEWFSLRGNKSFSDSFLMDVRQFGDLPGIVNKPHLLKIADSIDKAGKQVGALQPMVREIVHLIEANTFEKSAVKKVKGNFEKSKS